MSFFSLQFLLFFVILFFLYYAVPKKVQWVLLLFASAFFYLSISWGYAAFLFLSIAITYLGSRIMGNFSALAKEKLKAEGLTKDDKKHIKKSYRDKKQIVLSLLLIINLGILAFFKYYHFLDVFNGLSLILPLGISFYTFTSIGYCIDIFREEYEVEKNPFKYALFVSFFPHIMQGPISKFSTLMPELIKEHQFDYDKTTNGLKLMAWGFVKKFVLAGQMELFINMVSEKNSSGIILILSTILYAFYIYADFSGYMDIVKGLSCCLGIKIAENFNQPYFSESVAEYWRRWHITLGEWFRNYLFYPIVRAKWCQGLSKYAKQLPAVVGLFIVWLCTGIWHGASLHYAVWGLYYGVLIIGAMLLKGHFEALGNKLKINVESKFFKTFRVLRTFFFVCVGYVFFQQPSMEKVFHVFSSSLRAMYHLDFSLHLNNLGLGIQTLAICAFSPLLIISVWFIQRKTSIIYLISKKPFFIRYLFYALALWTIVFLGAAFGENRFIYFQF